MRIRPASVVRLATVSRRHWLSEAVFRPEPKVAEIIARVAPRTPVSHSLVEDTLGHAGAVVGNPQVGAAPFGVELHIDPRGPGVEAVVNEVGHRRGEVIPEVAQECISRLADGITSRSRSCGAATVSWAGSSAPAPVAQPGPEWTHVTSRFPGTTHQRAEIE